MEVAEYGNTTIIITTHYIEEARQANRVGLMRNGRILAEANPLDLVEKYEEPASVCFRDDLRKKEFRFGIRVTVHGQGWFSLSDFRRCFSEVV